MVNSGSTNRQPCQHQEYETKVLALLKQTKEHKKCNWLGHAPTKGKLISYVLWFVFLSVQEQFDPSGIKHKCAWTERVVGSP